MIAVKRLAFEIRAAPQKVTDSAKNFCFSPLLDAAVLEDSSIQRKNHVFSFLLAFSDGIRYDGETGTS
ncbi:MAG: hypothetical protein ACLU3I_22675 [Acutalibacteraceae bacterium]